MDPQGCVLRELPRSKYSRHPGASLGSEKSREKELRSQCSLHNQARVRVRVAPNCEIKSATYLGGKEGGLCRRLTLAWGPWRLEVLAHLGLTCSDIVPL